ncbi:hypothetical protein WJ0W_006759 [Paenibacillus melissococcoides]|uniref:Uncharacterized protein n=1 Tax=Paenibacillus melissococcoides TaxID=2912268 RepID=A0ABN8UEM4_9BACL|nr:hypothetical protein [Paenibacillus melissococcoides]CAH8249574.1 hypothetical protein WJ0W_006759 [Paenibacillus melissococcoides]
MWQARNPARKKNEKSSSASSGSGSGINLNANYQNYLDTGSRGTAPKLSKTAATDIPPPVSTNQKLAALPF